MKNLLFIFSLFLAHSLVAQRGLYPVEVNIGGSKTTLYTQSHALVIGNSDYTAGWGVLSGVKGDVQRVKTALEQNGFDVVLKENLTKVQMNAEIESFLSNHGYKENNRVLIYYAGHGHTLNNNNTQMGYIVPVDAPDPRVNPQGFIQKALPMSNFKTWAESTTFAKHALFVFDACFAGSIFTSRGAPTANEVISYNTLNSVRQFIASGSADETVPDQSVFCTQFVYALQSSIADYNHDGYLTGTELGEYLKNTVIQYQRRQHPQYGKLDNPNFDKGDFVFVIKPPSATATLKITSEFAGELYIDNKYVKDLLNGKLYTETIETGSHTIEVRTTGYNWTQAVSLTQNQSLTLSPKAKTIAYGKLVLNSEISGELWIDAQYTNTDIIANKEYTQQLTEGSHRIEIRGTEPFNQTISIAANSHYTLNPKSSNRNISDNPKPDPNKNTDLPTNFVLVNGGSFTMGSNEYDNEKPPHQVT